MAIADDLLIAFELHSPDRIRKLLAKGASATALIKGKTPVDSLIEMYTRSERFADCLRALLNAGAEIRDSALQAIFLDDVKALREALQPNDVERRISLECAYTSLKGATLLHVCAEYNSVKCAKALIKAGADVNARAEFDRDGFGGHTPLFHTVNSNQNYCRPMMELLVGAGADLDIRLQGLVWAAGFEWETVVFDVTPISYAQCGLYRQFQRTEENVYSNIAFLYRKKYGTKAPIRNVPNQYLAKG